MVTDVREAQISGAGLALCVFIATAAIAIFTPTSPMLLRLAALMPLSTAACCIDLPATSGSQSYVNFGATTLAFQTLADTIAQESAGRERTAAAGMQSFLKAVDAVANTSE